MHPSSTVLRRLSPFLLLFFLTPAAGAADWSAAVAALRAGDYEAALAAARELVAVHPEHAGSHQLLGSALVGLDRPAEAVPAFDEALRLGGPEPPLLLALSRAQLGAGQAGEALVSLDRLLRIEGGAAVRSLEADQRRFLVSLLLKSARTSTGPAREVLERAVGVLPEQRLVWLALASEYRHEGRFDEAYGAYEKASTLDRSDTAAPEGALFCALQQAEGGGEAAGSWYRRAAGAADRLLELEPSAELYVQAGAAWLEAGEAERARERLTEAERRDGSTARLYYLLARSALLLDELQTAEGELLRAAALDTEPDLDKKIQRALGTLHHRRGDFAAAAVSYRRAGLESEALAMAALASEREKCLELEARARELDEAHPLVAATPEFRRERRGLEVELEACGELLAGRGSA